MRDCAHVIFGHSAAASLREALLTVRRRERVLNFWGTFHAGPIAAESDQSRIDWLVRNYFGVENDGELESEYLADLSSFGEAIAAAKSNFIVWFSSRQSREYCDFLEFLVRAETLEPLLIVDVGKLLIEPVRRKFAIEGNFIGSTGMMSPSDFLHAFGEEKPLQAGERRKLVEQWHQLAAENGDLRILVDGDLRSARIDHFDELLLLLVPNKLIGAARVVGQAIGDFDCDGPFTQGFSDLFWFSRLRSLAKSGAIEWDGAPDATMREVKVRRLQ